MKKIIALFILMAVAITGCGSNTTSKTSEEARDFPVKWANAMVQRDDKTRDSMIIKKTSALNPDNKKKNSLIIRNYELIEWKDSATHYYYRILYVDPTDNKKRVEDMEIEETKEGWKKPDFSSLRNLDETIAKKNLKEVIVREWDDK